MRILYFTHSLRSCWNHGNAHFLRGVLSELGRRGHDVVAYEPSGSWSLENLLRDAGDAGLEAYGRNYPDLVSQVYAPGFDVAAACENADLVIMHEWNDTALVAAAGAARRQGGSFTLLFHDTHHRAVSEPDAIKAFDLDGYDGVLAFGETLAEVYRGWGWGNRVFVWHEAADTHVFHPPARETERHGLVWIGNWGDDERSAELEAYLFGPAQRLGLGLDIYGVRYPDQALQTIDRAGGPTGAGCPTPPPRTSSPGIWRPCTCRAGSMSRCCPAFRPSGSLKPWPAAYRWCQRPGATAKRCSMSAAIS